MLATDGPSVRGGMPAASEPSRARLQCCAGYSAPQEDPGRRSGATLWVLRVRLVLLRHNRGHSEARPQALNPEFGDWLALIPATIETLGAQLCT
jgi:hypothetical protein